MKSALILLIAFLPGFVLGHRDIAKKPVSFKVTFHSGGVKEYQGIEGFSELLEFNELYFEDLDNLKSVEVAFRTGEKLFFNYSNGSLASLVLVTRADSLSLPTTQLKNLQGIHFSSILIVTGTSTYSTSTSPYASIYLNTGRKGFFDDFELAQIHFRDSIFKQLYLSKVDHQKFWHTLQIN